MADNTGWEEWQLQTLDMYIQGYSDFETQRDLANYLGKNINSVKIRLTRRKKEISEDIKEFSLEEYITIISNRFSKTSQEVAAMLNISNSFLLEKMDELDCLEFKESLLDGFEVRKMTNDEYEIFIKLHKIKKVNKTKISHILNRPLKFIEEMISEYENV